MGRRHGKRGTDHTWQVVKYLGDGAPYARCKCGHRYACGVSHQMPDGSWDLPTHPEIFWPYCPRCGARKKWYETEIIKIDKYSWE